jgi:hypothetical protein
LIDFDLICSDGRTPLHYSLYTREFEMAKVLLQHGVDVYIKDNTGKTAYDLLVEIPGWHQALAVYLPSKTGDSDKDLMEILRATRKFLLREAKASENVQLAKGQLTRAIQVLCDRLNVTDTIEVDEQEAIAFIEQQQQRQQQQKHADLPNTIDPTTPIDLRRLPAVIELIRSEERTVHKLDVSLYHFLSFPFSFSVNFQQSIHH